MKKTICLLLWLTVPPVVGEQSARPTTEPPILAVTGASFALYVANIEASAKWYSEKLGLKVVTHAPRRDEAAVTVLEGGGLIVELIQHDDAAPLSKAAAAKDNPLIHGMFKAGVIVDDFDKALAMLKARNVPIAFGPFLAGPNQRANAIIRDNAGNLIQVFGK
jgi:catechol 2,3-dioxygenase-like lactoylglutathione lyase family enzyme